MDKRVADASQMHRGELVKWAIKAYPNKPVTPFRKMLKKDLIRLYVNGGK